jgi:hypothetical protein
MSKKTNKDNYEKSAFAKRQAVIKTTAIIALSALLITTAISMGLSGAF